MNAITPTDSTDRFMDLLARHRQLIYKVCYLYATDTEHFKDLWQEVMINMWTGLNSFRGEAAESTWIYRVALNSCVSFYRKHRPRGINVDVDQAIEIEADDGSHTEQLREMYRLIGSLGKVDKAIVLLWLEDCSYDQIADIVGMTRANVASRLHRIKQRLRKQTE